MRDFQTAAAVKTKWDAIANITTLVPGGLLEAPVVEGSGEDGKGGRTPDFPYAALEVAKDGRANEISAGGAEIDYRRVKISIHALSKAQAASVGAIVDAAIAEQELAVEGGEWMRTESPGETRGGTIGRGERSNNGPLTWVARLEYVVWTSRE